MKNYKQYLKYVFIILPFFLGCLASIKYYFLFEPTPFEITRSGHSYLYTKDDSRRLKIENDSLNKTIHAKLSSVFKQNIKFSYKSSNNVSCNFSSLDLIQVEGDKTVLVTRRSFEIFSGRLSKTHFFKIICLRKSDLFKDKIGESLSAREVIPVMQVLNWQGKVVDGIVLDLDEIWNFEQKKSWRREYSFIDYDKDGHLDVIETTIEFDEALKHQPSLAYSSEKKLFIWSKKAEAYYENYKIYDESINKLVRAYQ